MNRANIGKAHRWVIKIGSALLTNDGAGINQSAIQGWVSQINTLIEQGKEVVLVSSGAIAEGVARLGWSRRPEAIHKLQAAAAVGQMGLIQTYESSFLRYHRRTAQILLDHDDLASRQRYLNARGAIKTLIELGVVPIVNENDTVVTDEIRFGDNDRLAALVASLIDADVLVILTDKDGLYHENPDVRPDAELIEKAQATDGWLDEVVGDSTSGLGRGGMITKLQAARLAASSGCSTIIAGGKNSEVLLNIAAGHQQGTLLTANHKPITARKRWLAGQLQVRGNLTVDDGAVEVLCKRGRSLLPVGVVAVQGEFNRGDLISCRDLSGVEVARGLVNFNAEEAEKIKGQSTAAIVNILGYKDNAEMIHRDNLVLK